jgi:hypothetical protein
VDAAARLAAVAVLAAAACGPLPAPHSCPSGAGRWDVRVLARGTLAYAAAARPGVVVALELDTRFALIVHDARSGAVRARVDLGPPERDLGALALAGDGRRAWVGGEDQRVRTVDLGARRVTATWPVGATVTALAAVGGAYVAVGDATGVVCLRRPGGALLQCVAAAGGPIARLAAGPGPALAVTAAGRVTRYQVPSLRVLDGGPAPAPPALPPGLHLGGPVRDLHRVPGGVVIAAWVHGLDDPSVVVARARLAGCDL